MLSSPDTPVSQEGLQRLGRYVLLEKVAEGGMAEVFRAAAIGSAGFNKMLAIKRILPHLARDPDFGAMFIDEAKIAAQLSHPNILQVQDLGNQDGQHFIVMEYVSGRALNRLLAECVSRGSRLPLALACAVISQALTGLSYAHQKRDARGQPLNIIHRDITPHNIMLGYDGSVKLADFGIARAETRTSKTTTGSIKGKPAYMAPEQVMPDHPLDQRLDIYAMGVVLFEMLTMTRLRRSRTDVETLMEVAQGRVPTFEERGAEVPADLAAVAYRALSKEPDARFQTAEEFRVALADVVRVHGWHWDSTQTQELMTSLFTTDIRGEEEAQEKYVTLIEKLSQADATSISRVFHSVVTARRAGAPEAQTDGTVRTDPPVPPSPNRLPWIAVGTAAVALLAGAAALLARPSEATLFVASTPPGATVTVNGRAMPGVTPLALEHLPPGPADVVVALAEHVAEKKTVVLVPGVQAATLSFVMERVTRTVTFTTSPPGAVVTLDGKELGPSPVQAVLATDSTVSVKAALDGYQPLSESRPVSAMPDQVTLTLQPARRAAEPSAAARGSGTLTLVSRPWARVAVDGRDTGRFTPLDRFALPAGSHLITLRNDQQDLTVKFKVTIQADHDLKLTKELR